MATTPNSGILGGVTAKNLPFSQLRRLGNYKRHEFSIVDSFPKGYRHREDITNLPPGVLVVGSQNVLTNISERIQIRQGYVMDGAQATAITTQGNSFDWVRNGGGTVNMRAGGLSNAGNDGHLQFRYVDSMGNVTWRDLLTAQTSVAYNYCNFWDDEELLRVCLFVNGASQIQEWNGAVTTIASVSNATGVISGFTTAPAAGGSGYVVGDILTINGGTGGTCKVVLASNQVITSSSKAANGTLYTAGDVLNVIDPTGQGSGGQILVNTIFGGGAVNAYSLVSGGSGYQLGIYNVYGGTGEGFQLQVTGTSGGVVTSVVLVSPGSGYSATTETTSGGTGTGCTVTITSVVQGSITKVGPNTWAQDGFYSQISGKKVLLINGTRYTYTGGETTLTLTGITGDPTPEGPGSIVQQAVYTTLNSSITDLPATFQNGLISCLANQVYIGALNSSIVYVSKTNDYDDFSFNNPRQPSDGATATLDANLVAFVPQENDMYISCGRDFWYNTIFTLSSDNMAEAFDVQRLKTAPSQGAISQAAVSQMKNQVIFISNEPTLDQLGRVEQILGTPQTKNISDPIKLDFDSYNFTNAAVFYHRYFIYVAIPEEGLVRMFNLATQAWEAPQILPVSRFYVVDGNLYGHSYTTFESYQLFTGYSDRATATAPGVPIDAKAVFSYENYGTRFSLKMATKFYIEGYISANTKLNSTITYEIDGCATTQSFVIDGNDQQIVCISKNSNSLGKNSLGKVGLGTEEDTSVDNLPPKFRAIETFAPHNFYECQFSFEILGVDQRFEILAWGLNAVDSTDIQTNITQ